MYVCGAHQVNKYVDSRSNHSNHKHKTEHTILYRIDAQQQRDDWRTPPATNHSMSSWAAVASAASKPKPAAVTTVPEGITAVVDANAIISGMQLDRLGDTAVTIPAVLAEIRDAASRQRLATLPLGITTMEPSEDSIAAGSGVNTAHISHACTSHTQLHALPG